MGYCDIRDVEHLLASGFAGGARKLTLATEKYLGRNWSVLPLTAVTAGIQGLEELPYALSRAEGFSNSVRVSALKELAPLFDLSPGTKETIKRLFYTHAMDRPDILYASIVREAPEAEPVLPLMKDFFDRIWNHYVVTGALDPEQRIVNYFPVVRDSKEVRATGTMMIERGKDYFPVTIENVLSSYSPDFVKSRRFLDPKAMPEKMSFDDVLKVYTAQYARHYASEEFLGEFSQILQHTPEELKSYIAEHMHSWLGKSGKGVSELTRALTNFQFIRTIGFNVLSPMQNSLQKMNTFAVAGPKAFSQGLLDMNDPARLEIARRANLGWLMGEGLEDLSKFGLDAAIGGTGLLGKWASKSGQWFSNSEKSNKLHAFMTGLRMAEARGLTNIEDRLKFGLRLMDDTQFIHSAANMAPALRTDAGRVLGQFSTFRLNQAHFMTKLVDEAVSGWGDFGRTGDFNQAWKGMAPFMRFWGASMALGGLAVVPMGEWMEERAVRANLEKAGRQPGLLEWLLGVHASTMFGMGAIGADDLQSFLFYLGGPTLGMAKGLASAVTGLNLDPFSGSPGRDIGFSERTRHVVQSLPHGVTANRLMQSLKLFQNDGRYREALDMSEYLGLKAPSGDLLSSNASKTAETLLQAIGLQPEARFQERKMLTRQRDMDHDFSVATSEAAEYMASGKYAEASKRLRKFSELYRDQLPGPIEFIDPAAIRAAIIRRVTPPGQRKRPMGALIGSEPFLGPTQTISELLERR